MLVHILEGFEMARCIELMNLKEWSVKHGLACADPSLAVQSQKDEADINTIVRNFGVTGRMPAGVKVPSYGDFEGVADYRSALEAVNAAELSFNALPSEVRSKFANDPQAFLEFCSDVGNLEEMRKLGLAVTPVAPDGSA